MPLTSVAPFATPLADKSASTLFYVYVDSIGVISADPAKAAAARDGVVKSFADQGISCHTGSAPATILESLGVEFNSELGVFRPTYKRYWYLRLAARWLLRRRQVRGDQLETLLGHFTYFGLIRRPVLSVFASCYKFVRACYDHPAVLWASARQEIWAFLGLMPLVVAEWSLPWSPVVLCYDSCPEGRGFCCSEWDPEDVARAGRVVERLRFKRRYGGRPARQPAPPPRHAQPRGNGVSYCIFVKELSPQTL